MTDHDKKMLRQLYEQFNARAIEDVLVHLAEDVIWANGMEGGYVHGRDGVRDYWTRQWAVISVRGAGCLSNARRGYTRGSASDVPPLRNSCTITTGSGVFPSTMITAYSKNFAWKVQSGLSWRSILAKREKLRAAFLGFDFNRVAQFTDADIELLVQDPGIVRQEHFLCPSGTRR